MPESRFCIASAPLRQPAPHALFMKTLLLSLIALGAVSGCASRSLYWGPALSTCSGPGSAPNFTKGACRSGAEYDIARKKATNSSPDAVSGDDKHEVGSR